MNECFEKLATPDGTIVEVYSKSNKLHCDDGPAWRMVTADGLSVQMHFKNGVLSRFDGPAITFSNKDGAGADAYYHDGERVNPPLSPRLRRKLGLD